MGQLLVVDDEPHVARVIQVSFQRHGWTVAAADSLAEARLQLLEAQFDIIFLDVKLPDGSGLDFLREIRKKNLASDTPVVVLSGAEFEDVRQRVRDLGGEYVAKPFSPTKLLQLAEKMLTGGTKAE